MFFNLLEIQVSSEFKYSQEDLITGKLHLYNNDPISSGMHMPV